MRTTLLTLVSACVMLGAIGRRPGLRVAAPTGRLTLAPAEARWVTVSLRLPAEQARRLGPGVHPMRFSIRRVEAGGPSGVGDARELFEKSTFMVPR